MNKLKFSKSEAIAFIEELILSNAATDEQEELYNTYMWTGKLEKNDTYKGLIKQMRKLFEEKY